MTFSRRFVSARRTAALSIVTLFVGCSGVGVPLPVHPAVEPPDRDAYFLKREQGWTYTRTHVTLPIQDLVDLKHDRDDWKMSSDAHHNAVEWGE